MLNFTEDFLYVIWWCLPSSKQYQLKRLLWTVWGDHMLTRCPEICPCCRCTPMPTGLSFLCWLIRCQSRKGEKHASIILQWRYNDIMWLRFKPRVPNSCLLNTRFFSNVVLLSLSLRSQSMKSREVNTLGPWAWALGFPLCSPLVVWSWKIPGFFLESVSSLLVLSEKWCVNPDSSDFPLTLSIPQQILRW